MEESKYFSFTGQVFTMENIGENFGTGCNKILIVQNQEGETVHFIVSPYTYFLDYARVRAGDTVTVFYRANAAVTLIYPPQYYAAAVALTEGYPGIKMDFFDENMVSMDKTLQLTPDENTETVLINNQYFEGNIQNHDLLVTYGAATRSIPAQATPMKIVVFCQ